MEDQISSKIKNMVSSELSKYPEARKNIKNYLSEKESEEKRNNPKDYLKDSEDMKQIYLLAKEKK
jgi:hypothetical protein